MRIVPIALALGLSILSSGTAAQQTGLFTEYTALVTPKSDIPIGAYWIPGIGPDGSGAPPDDVSVQRGGDAIKVSASVRRQMGLSLAKFIGFSGNASAVKSVEVEGVEIHRVKDLTKLEVAAGRQILYEGIKADKITLSIDASQAASLTANAKAKGIPIVAEAGGGNTRKITFDGSDLFLAYQVIGFSKPIVKTVVKKHFGKELYLNNDEYRLTFCRCHENGDVDIRLQNVAAVTTGGAAPAKLVTFTPSNGGWLDLTMPQFMNGNEYTVPSATIRYMPEGFCGITRPNGSEGCMYSYPGETNNITLRTVRFKVQPIKKPSGTY